jgi:hypothetical protein
VRLLNAAPGSPDRLAFTADKANFYLTDQHNYRFFRLTGSLPVVAAFGSGPKAVSGSSSTQVEIDPMPEGGVSGGGSEPNLRE